MTEAASCLVHTHSSLLSQDNRATVFSWTYSSRLTGCSFQSFLMLKVAMSLHFGKLSLKGRNMTLFLPSYLLAAVWNVHVMAGAPAVTLDYKTKS